MAKDDTRETKQVIVMRTDLNMRKGKMVAQGAHGSMAFLTRRIFPFRDSLTDYENLSDDTIAYRDKAKMPLKKAELEWLQGSFKKICVGVGSEDELLQVYADALGANLEAYIVTDSGLTEFAGVPTRTCCAIGPDYADKIDSITGGLKLL
jgi:PTH2 family peptidyl-tRNA hydrolase